MLLKLETEEIILYWSLPSGESQIFFFPSEEEGHVVHCAKNEFHLIVNSIH